MSRALAKPIIFFSRETDGFRFALPILGASDPWRSWTNMDIVARSGFYPEQQSLESTAAMPTDDVGQAKRG
jgi:hypothetical protein